MADRIDPFTDPTGAMEQRYSKWYPKLHEDYEQAVTANAPGMQANVTMFALGARTPLGNSFEQFDENTPKRWENFLKSRSSST
jgi:hypothetical protein